MPLTFQICPTTTPPSSPPTAYGAPPSTAARGTVVSAALVAASPFAKTLYPEAASVGGNEETIRVSVHFYRV